jgi:GT2 family glycosyltransferase
MQGKPSMNQAMSAGRKPIRIVCATRGNRQQFLETTALGQSLKPHSYVEAADSVQLQLFENNSRGLSAVYNTAIQFAQENPAILVFIHDDVWLCDFFFHQRIYEALDRFDIVGLAGNTRRVPYQPTWASTTLEFKWDNNHLSGAVGHGKGLPYDSVFVYGPAGVECKLLDGLMLVADSAKLIANGLGFDEKFAFHFYDLDFCRQAEIRGLRMGTWPLSVIHGGTSPFNTPDWKAGYEQYLRKYGD